MLGALADQLGAKKRFLLGFTLLGVLATGCLYWLGAGQWQAALLLYLAGLLGFFGGNIFNDALITDVARARATTSGPRRWPMRWAIWAAGCCSRSTCCMVLMPERFGFADEGGRCGRPSSAVALWWALFALPLALFVPESGGALGGPLVRRLRGALRELSGTFRQVRALPNTFLFLLAYWFYIDGVDTIMFMAVKFGLDLGFESSSLMVALLITQFVGFPAALVFGRLGVRDSAPSRHPRRHRRLCAGGAGRDADDPGRAFLCPGGEHRPGAGRHPGLSRALFASLIPAGQTAELFGFYNMVGKFAAVLGPFLVGSAAALAGDPRLSLLPILLLFALGATLLWRVDVRAGREAATGRQPGR
jgi:UMF1 family MFS transporter